MPEAPPLDLAIACDGAVTGPWVLMIASTLDLVNFALHHTVVVQRLNSNFACIKCGGCLVCVTPSLLHPGAVPLFLLLVPVAHGGPLRQCCWMGPKGGCYCYCCQQSFWGGCCVLLGCFWAAAVAAVVAAAGDGGDGASLPVGLDTLANAMHSVLWPSGGLPHVWLLPGQCHCRQRHRACLWQRRPCRTLWLIRYLYVQM